MLATTGSMVAEDSAPPISGTLTNFTPAESLRPVPETSFVGLDGTKSSLADFRGRVVVLNFWATWCRPCIREMPSLDRLQAELGGQNFSVVLVSQDRNGEDRVPSFLARLGLKHLTSYLDPLHPLFRAFGSRVLPTTILIDTEGNELGRLDGPAEWDRPEALALIRHYLE